MFPEDCSFDKYYNPLLPHEKKDNCSPNYEYKNLPVNNYNKKNNYDNLTNHSFDKKVVVRNGNVKIDYKALPTSQNCLGYNLNNISCNTKLFEPCNNIEIQYRDSFRAKMLEYYTYNSAVYEHEIEELINEN